MSSQRTPVGEVMDVSASSESSADDGLGWEDVEAEKDEPPVIVSLLDEKLFSDAGSMLKYCRDEYAFDFLATRNRLDLDFYGTIKLVNYVRQCKRDGVALPQSIATADIEDDKYLKPVLEDDALIFTLDELDLDGPAPSSVAAASFTVDEPSQQSLAQANRKLQDELAAITSQFADYRLLVEDTLEKRWGDDSPLPSPSVSQSSRPRDASQYYWESYATNDIHETMLKDTIRTDAYRDFVYENKHLFKGKIVLDIGCGTGILSMFCAKAGAKTVFAVDKSDIIDKARENVFHNGLSDTVTCIRGRVEDLSLPVDKVDIIISEWMGYCLLYEAMLPSVLYARDKFLKPEGLLVPSFASIWMAPVSDPEFVADHISFWDDVYGFNMKAMQAGIYDDARIDVWPSSTVCGAPSQIAHFDLHKINVQDLDFSSKWQSVTDRSIESLDGLLVWFDIFFTGSRQDSVPAGVEAKPSSDKERSLTTFTTGPFNTETHWKQGFLHLDRSKGVVPVKSGTQLSGEIVFKAPEDQPRALDISAAWNLQGSEQRSQTWKLR